MKLVMSILCVTKEYVTVKLTGNLINIAVCHRVEWKLEWILCAINKAIITLKPLIAFCYGNPFMHKIMQQLILFFVLFVVFASSYFVSAMKFP